jgi:hypothetical protein
MVPTTLIRTFRKVTEDRSALGRPTIGILCADAQRTITTVVIPHQEGRHERELVITPSGQQQLVRWFTKRPLTPVGYIKVGYRTWLWLITHLIPNHSRSSSVLHKVKARCPSLTIPCTELDCYVAPAGQTSRTVQPTEHEMPTLQYFCTSFMGGYPNSIAIAVNALQGVPVPHSEVEYAMYGGMDAVDIRGHVEFVVGQVAVFRLRANHEPKAQDRAHKRTRV